MHLIKRFSFINLKCKPFLACFRHGRCWTHSEWEPINTEEKLAKFIYEIWVRNTPFNKDWDTISVELRQHFRLKAIKILDDLTHDERLLF